MKILHVVPYFNPKRGGDVNVCANLAKEFVNKKHEVTIITTDFELNNEYYKSIEKEGVNLIHFRSLFNKGLLIYSPEMKKWLDKNIQEYDIVHLHTFRSYQNILILNYCKKYNVPYIIQAHGSVLPFSQNKILKKIYDVLWGYKLLNNSFKVIALTETESKQYQNMKVPAKKIEIIPNGINLKDYENLPKKGEFRKKYAISENEKIILYLGRIHKIKGIDLLLDAFSKISEDFDDVKLVIVGPDDGYLKKIEKKVNLIENGKILIIGPLYDKNKLEAYIDADVYVLPSIYETFPMTVLESLACGTPVIITDRCGISDIIKNNEIGFVVDYERNSLINSLIQILKFNGPKNIESNININFLQDHFNLVDSIKKLEKIYYKK